MNYIWCGIVVISFICATINGTITETVTAIADGSFAAIKTVLSFAGIMCFWCGIMKIMEKSDAMKIVQRIINPIIILLFPRADKISKEFISMNITSNILGLGNAATPAGIKAMSALDKSNNSSSYPSYEMCMFIILNTTAFQLVPTIIMSLRAAAGGNPTSVIVPIWITSLASVILTAISVKLFYKVRTKEDKCNI